MKPIDAARAMYHKEPCGRCFGDDLATFLRIGYVFSTPTAFIMGKAVPSPHIRTGFGYDRPGANAPIEHCDTWLIWLAAGDLREFFRFEPRPMKFVAWARKGVIRFHHFDRVRALCKTSTESSIFLPSAQTVAR